MPYSGGKFLANCLALSRHVLCMKEEFARSDVYWTNPIDSEYYKFKLKSIMGSLPPVSKLKQWAQYEYSDNLFRIADNPLISSRIICHTAHTNEQLAEKIKQHPTVRIIKLTNHQKFAQMCYQLKSSENDPRRFKYTVASWNKNSVDGNFEFDINTVFDPDLFCAEMQRLYGFLSLDDFQTNLVKQFRLEYLACHGLT